MATVTTVKEGRRGCGYRQAGGLYLRSDGIPSDCGILPIPLHVCPTCHGGIKPARSWTWINFRKLVTGAICRTPARCGNCPSSKIEMAGLLWIGKKYYTPREWLEESHAMGVSRRIPNNNVPKNFKLGETWVAVAHQKAIESPFVFGVEPEWSPAIFHLFKPTRLEYVVRGNESEKKLDAMEKRGITLVKVEQI